MDGSVRGVRVEAGRGRPFPPRVHRRAAVGDGGAVRPAHPRSDGGPRHVEPDAAQPVEGHGGHLYKAQRDPHRHQGLQSHPHRVLSFTLPFSASLSSWFLPRPTIHLPFFSKSNSSGLLNVENTKCFFTDSKLDISESESEEFQVEEKLAFSLQFCRQTFTK